MPKALLDLDRCSPERCEDGVCAARRVCSIKAIFQAERFDQPFIDWSRCRACAKCVGACPSRAVSLVD